MCECTFNSKQVLYCIYKRNKHQAVYEHSRQLAVGEIFWG